uniref:G-protein coupled receptors family 1 profile domain-containing protein n=1 Tax=Romanomermis culicivorax TaxID=13658 RepID=A0A915IFT1_ROMCU
MFNESNSHNTICSNEQTSLFSFLLAIAFIMGIAFALITNCINLKIFMRKRYPTITLSIYLMVLCFMDTAILSMNILLWRILVLSKMEQIYEIYEYFVQSYDSVGSDKFNCFIDFFADHLHIIDPLFDK